MNGNVIKTPRILNKIFDRAIDMRQDRFNIVDIKLMSLKKGLRKIKKIKEVIILKKIEK